MAEREKYEPPKLVTPFIVMKEAPYEYLQKEPGLVVAQYNKHSRTLPTLVYFLTKDLTMMGEAIKARKEIPPVCIWRIRPRLAPMSSFRGLDSYVPVNDFYGEDTNKNNYGKLD